MDHSNSVIGVCIVTYNQEDYIGQAIESVIRQNCTWPFMLYIGQDCSTDKTRAICERYAIDYPEKIVLINRESNQGLVGNTMSLLARMRQDGSCGVGPMNQSQIIRMFNVKSNMSLTI